MAEYKIQIPVFEGPLDLLCHLIEKNKMDIYDINLNEITDQYIQYLNQMEKMNLEIYLKVILIYFQVLLLGIGFLSLYLIPSEKLVLIQYLNHLKG